MVQVIEEAFADVPPTNASFPELSYNFGGTSGQYKTACLKPSVTSRRVADPDLLQAIYEAVKIEDCGQSPVCAAIRASQKAFARLEALFPEGPKHVNSMLVTREGNASWLPGTAKMTGPGSAEIIDGNGANAYALCEVTRVIVQQDAHQQGTNTCGWVSLLQQAVLNDAVGLFKAGTQLLWTGRVSTKFAMPCPSVFGLQPGLDLYDGQARQIGGQPFGLTFAWPASLLSAARQESGLSCADVPQLLFMVGRDGNAQVSEDFEKSVPSELAGTAQKLFGKAPEVVLNYESFCPPVELQACKKLMLYPYIFPYGGLRAQTMLNEGLAWQDVVQDPAVALTSRQLSQLLGRPESEETFVTGVRVIEKSMTKLGLTPQEVSAACEAAEQLGRGVSIQVNAGIFPNQENEEKCDHWIVLKGCGEGDVATVWTWGAVKQLGKSTLFSNTCAALVMDVSL